MDFTLFELAAGFLLGMGILYLAPLTKRVLARVKRTK